MESVQNGSLVFDWLTSQSYDGASNMRGAINGLQARIGKRAPKAIYNWCYAHRLNLVIEGMIASCTPIRNAIGIVEELYVSFNGHKRHEVFMESQKDFSHKKNIWHQVLMLQQFKMRQQHQQSKQSLKNRLLQQYSRICHKPAATVSHAALRF